MAVLSGVPKAACWALSSSLSSPMTWTSRWLELSWPASLLTTPRWQEEERAEPQESLNKIVAWAAKWGMKFNVTKCKVMHFGRNNPRHNYVMHGTLLEKTDEERDLGVLIMSSAKPAAQCAKAACRLTTPRLSWVR